MSLDVYLTVKGAKPSLADPTIPVREDGRVKMLNFHEWNERFPDREPFMTELPDNEVYSGNITHNLHKMAEEAGVCNCLWRPHKVGIGRAEQLVKPLRQGLEQAPGQHDLLEPQRGQGRWDLR